MSETTKPRIRVAAGRRIFSGDSYTNFAANIGYGTRNLSSASSYSFSPISRNHVQLEFMYRGSWLVRQIVDAIAEDMTRAGVTIQSDMEPDEEASLMETFQHLQLWQSIQATIKWARLYGGCLAVMLIDGQDPTTPLKAETIRPGQFRGLMVIDRWMCTPDLEHTIREFGPDFGLPEWYNITSDAHSVPRMKVHYSRCIRFEGADLPYWQKIAENMWGLSVIEPMFDRMIAFDSATQGAAQLVYKAHLRTLSIPNLRQLIASGGSAYEGLKRQIDFIRLAQSNEGMTLLDAEDNFQTYQYAFGGLSDVLVQFGQQLSGAAQIPLVRLFGQSPAGLNATGESDIRNYYDMINAQQEAKMRRPLTILFEVVCRSVFGQALPNGFTFRFTPLWQLQETEKAQASSTITQTVLSAFEGGVIGAKTVLKELRESSHLTGVWTNITDEQIEQADEDPPNPQEQMGGMEGMGGDPSTSGLEGEEAPSAIPGAPQAEGPSGSEVGPSPSKVGEPAEDDQALPPLIGPRRRPKPRLHPLDEIIERPRRRKRARRVLSILRGDRRSIVDIEGLQCIVETAKGEVREGPGWSVTMPVDYGYISGTSSQEGPREQMDCFIGDDPQAGMAYVIHQYDLATGEFDEHKVMLNFPNKQAAFSAYCNAFSDGRGGERAKQMVPMTIPHLKRWLKVWKYGKEATQYIDRKGA